MACPRPRWMKTTKYITAYPLLTPFLIIYDTFTHRNAQRIPFHFYHFFLIPPTTNSNHITKWMSHELNKTNWYYGCPFSLVSFAQLHAARFITRPYFHFDKTDGNIIFCLWMSRGLSSFIAAYCESNEKRNIIFDLEIFRGRPYRIQTAWFHTQTVQWLARGWARWKRTPVCIAARTPPPPPPL